MSGTGRERQARRPGERAPLLRELSILHLNLLSLCSVVKPSTAVVVARTDLTCVQPEVLLRVGFKQIV